MCRVVCARYITGDPECTFAETPGPMTPFSALRGYSCESSRFCVERLHTGQFVLLDARHKFRTKSPERLKYRACGVPLYHCVGLGLVSVGPQISPTSSASAAQLQGLCPRWRSRSRGSPSTKRLQAVQPCDHNGGARNERCQLPCFKCTTAPYRQCIIPSSTAGRFKARAGVRRGYRTTSFCVVWTSPTDLYRSRHPAF
jgi:hypothetical protein